MSEMKWKEMSRMRRQQYLSSLHCMFIEGCASGCLWALSETYITERGYVPVLLAHCKVLNSLSATYLFYWCYRLYQLFKNCTLRIIKTSDCLTYEVLYIKKKIHLRDDLWLDCREKVKKKKIDSERLNCFGNDTKWRNVSLVSRRRNRRTVG